MFKAFEWLSKFSNQYWGLGRTHAIRRGRRSYKAKAINTRSNDACRLLWARWAISRWRKITRDRDRGLARCSNVKNSNKKRRTIFFDLRDFLTCCFRFERQKYVYAAWNLTPSIPNLARAGKRGNIWVGHNVSATMCPRLPVPLLSCLESVTFCSLDPVWQARTEIYKMVLPYA